MLTACGSSSSGTTLVDEPTENSGVVAYVLKNMDADEVGDHQAAAALVGSETEDKATAIDEILDNAAIQVQMNDVDTLRQRIDYNRTANATYVVVVDKEDYDDDDMGEFILEVMRKNHDVAAANPGRYIFSNISVFDAELSIDGFSVYGSFTIDGTKVDSADITKYWVVVLTTEKAEVADTYSGLIN